MKCSIATSPIPCTIGLEGRHPILLAVQRERVAAVVEVLEEAEGRIRIEDVLPLFPDFVTIDAFKAAICASLEDYNAQIERLKFEMADATRMADALR